MDKQENAILITLYDKNGKAVEYRIEKIFQVEGSAQLYCAIVPIDGDEVAFLKCFLEDVGEENQMLSVADITDASEYGRVANEYHCEVTQAAVQSVKEELSEYEDYITLTDRDGNEVSFIIHTVFEDTETKRSYVAMQQIDDAGKIFEEISLYRFEENKKSGDATVAISMIPSDMEYERVRNLFMGLIENS